jgi:hypothetical protein
MPRAATLTRWLLAVQARHQYDQVARAVDSLDAV